MNLYIIGYDGHIHIYSLSEHMAEDLSGKPDEDIRRRPEVQAILKQHGLDHPYDASLKVGRHTQHGHLVYDRRKELV